MNYFFGALFTNYASCYQTLKYRNQILIKDIKNKPLIRDDENLLNQINAELAMKEYKFNLTDCHD